MKVKIIDIGNSKGIRLPKQLIEEYNIGSEMELKPIAGELLLCQPGSTRKGWEQQMKKAIAKGDKPDKDLFEDLSNDFDQTEWTWPE